MPPIAFRSGWYLLYTKPRHEKKVAGTLSEIKVRLFLPTVKKLTAWHDRKKYVDVPLFPSYIFVRLEDRHDHQNCLNTEGVLYFVRFGKEIAHIPETVIDNISLMVNKGAGIEVSYDYFEPGHQFTIQHGPLTGLFCEFVEYKGKKNFLVRVQLLQRNLLMTVSADYLLAVPA